MDNVLHFKTDDVIIKENAETFSMYLVKSGAVVLYLNYGMESEHLLGIVSAGKIFGENGLSMGGTNIYTAVALGDTTVVRITRSNFREYVANNPETVVGLIKSLTSINSLLKHNIDILIDEFVVPEHKLEYMNKINSNIAKETVRENLKGAYHYNKA